jgi:hypothetical protein
VLEQVLAGHDIEQIIGERERERIPLGEQAIGPRGSFALCLLQDRGVQVNGDEARARETAQQVEAQSPGTTTDIKDRLDSVGQDAL